MSPDEGVAKAPTQPHVSRQEPPAAPTEPTQQSPEAHLPVTPSPSHKGPSAQLGPEVDPIPEYVVADILNYVQHELGKRGAAVRIAYDRGRLIIPDQPDGVAVNITPWAPTWEKVDERGRLRRAADAARQLAARKAPGTSRKKTTVLFAEIREVAARFDLRLIAGLAILIICGLVILNEDLTGSSTEEASSDDGVEEASAPVAPDESTPDRSSRVCSSTMGRVFQGGSVSVADVDGWRVEVALLKTGGKEPLDTHPFLKELVKEPAARGGSKFIWPAESGLVTVDTSDTLVEVRRTTLGEGPAAVRGVTLTFGGTLVDAYFKESGRKSYYHIANTLSEKLGATHTAVYAKCFDGEIHALGGWFRGLTAPGAATAMVYFMGTYAKPIHVARPYYRLPSDTDINRPHAFRSIAEKTEQLTRADLATLVGNEGGMASGKPGEPVFITFPFRDGNRASRASRNVVRVTSLGH